MTLEWVNCDFCGESQTTAMLTLRDLKLGLPGEFHLVRCNRCGLMYLNPRLNWEELQQYYERYPSHIFADFSSLSWIERYGIIRRCNLVYQYQRYGRLLDVGCATGTFLQAMDRFGEWELYGVEPMTNVASRITRNTPHIKVFQGTLLESGLPENFFNVVTWWDVLEHTPNPTACLRETFRVLQPGGWVFIQTPDPNSWEVRLFDSFWIGYDAPRHLHLFPRSVLVRRLEEIGFKIVRVGGFAGNISTACKSAGHWLRSQRWKRMGEMVLKISDSIVLRIATVPIYILLRSLDLTSSVLYIAQKPHRQ